MDRVIAFYDDDSGEYRWARRNDSGVHIATSHSAYPSLDQALYAARQAHPGLPVRAVPAAVGAPAVVFMAPPDDDAPAVDTAPAEPGELVAEAAHDEGPPCTF